MMKFHNIEQGSQEWLDLRLGKITASRFKDVFSSGRGSAPSKTRASYMMQLVAEIITGLPQNSFQNDAMIHGNECEPQARSNYELYTGVEVDQIGFVSFNDLVGVSPDGLVGREGLLEIKCPKTTTQIQRYLDSVFPPEYKAQVQGQMWVCEREWCDFVSFDPRINGEARYFCTRVVRDDVFIKDMTKKINIFIGELSEILDKLDFENAVVL